MESFLQDARYSLRALVKTPTITGIVVITLALGIGVNSAIFSILNGWLFRPLPVPAARQIVVLASQHKGQSAALSYPALVDLRSQAHVFSDVFAYGLGIAGLSVEHTPREFTFSSVTGNYFAALGLKPAAGRLFLPGEGEKPGDEAVVVLGYSYWQKNFGADPGIIGKQVLLDGTPATIVGVAPKGFQGLLFAFDLDGYIPLDTALSAERVGDARGYWTDRSDRFLTVVGRLKPNIGIKQAQSSVDLIAARMASEYPSTDKDAGIRVIPEWKARPAPFVSSFVPIIAGLFLTLPAFVLLLACMNVANILLVRATLRGREMAIRAALGGSRSRLLRLVLTESVLMALLGGGAGVAFGYGAISVSGSMLHSTTSTSSGFGYRVDYSLDLRVLAYTLITAALSGIVAGLWPAFRVLHGDVNLALHGSPAAGPKRFRWPGIRGMLVIAQVSGSLTLLVVAGLFMRSLVRAEHMFLGFDPDHVMSVMMTPRQIGFDETRTENFYHDLEERVRTMPGVELASESQTVPMGMPGPVNSILVEGQPVVPGERPRQVSSNRVDPNYFATMRVPLLEGRTFTESDDKVAPRVAVVNQTMARRFWPNQSAIGKRFNIGTSSGNPIEVVGVVADGQYFFVSPDPQPYFFVPLAQNYTPFRYLEVRSPLPPSSLADSIEEQVHKLAPDLPIIDARTMQDTVHGLAGLFTFRLAAALAGAIGLLGLILAVVGVYGVVSYTAAQRTREIGVRIALGAKRRDIVKLVFGQGLRLVAAGIVSGVGLAAMLTRVMSRLLIGVGATDPLTYSLVALLLGTVALLACWLPAHRATNVDPMVTLRSE
jgi:putative ABC transport system permease protein